MRKQVFWDDKISGVSLRQWYKALNHYGKIVKINKEMVYGNPKNLVLDGGRYYLDIWCQGRIYTDDVLYLESNKVTIDRSDVIKKDEETND